MFDPTSPTITASDGKELVVWIPDNGGRLVDNGTVRWTNTWISFVSHGNRFDIPVASGVYIEERDAEMSSAVEHRDIEETSTPRTRWFRRTAGSDSR